jgi:hypothetical protein
VGVLHRVHQYDEAGAAGWPHHPGPDAVPHARGAGRSGEAAGRARHVGLHLRAGRPRAARQADAPLHRGDRLTRRSPRTWAPSSRRAWSR